MAGFQERGRGRIGRIWEAGQDSALLCTLLLRYPGLEAMPEALTLRTGLALALAIEEFAPGFRPEIKWPNDLMLDGKKTAGILTEADGKIVYIGMGINVFQRKFSAGLTNKATSIALALDRTGRNPGAGSLQGVALRAADLETGPAGQDSRLVLLEKILDAMHREFESEAPWLDRLEARLYMKEKPVRFAPGGPDSEQVVEGILKGIGPGGELLLEDASPAGDGGMRCFTNGELRVYEDAPGQ
jgi:BirA family biotin operon repressor/biotin-[acetyl-CoA-carboxylase] ligase